MSEIEGFTLDRIKSIKFIPVKNGTKKIGNREKERAWEDN